ncbi:YMR090W-like protein [Saccharomyces cerevisiae x Saccharomyces kudriavzevii VIN7]|uniref:YMR090W-like protein n=1 Tax=Saccharomyces cerevisiae x Saccharomyces kudriavzevii (strain VIN7) TaxID=1095631 RepID=H0GZA7_SACCK|nr:YMR090W-like protein [Saccharomyces cerevisiae x Saccharomyces kudriavzevii VIN7]
MSPLKVAVVGASGKVGCLLINQLNSNSSFSTPLAIVRTQDQVDHFKNEVRVDASLTDIENASVSEIADAIDGYDAVVFSAGAGGKGIGRIFTVDLDGCIKVVEACEKAGVKRFIVVSALKAEERDFWCNIKGLREYYIAKRSADREVRDSKLDYTILQPGSLELNKGTGLLQPLNRLEEKASVNYSINREDVASFIVQSLLHPDATVKKTISLVNGDEPIETFIQGL